MSGKASPSGPISAEPGDADVFEQNLGGPPLIDGRVLAQGDSGGVLVEDEDRHPLPIALAAAGAGR